MCMVPSKWTMLHVLAAFLCGLGHSLCAAVTHCMLLMHPRFTYTLLVQAQKLLKVLPWLCKVTNPLAKDGRARIRFVDPWPPNQHLMHFKNAKLLAEHVKKVDEVSHLHSTSTSVFIHSQACLLYSQICVKGLLTNTQIEPKGLVVMQRS